MRSVACAAFAAFGIVSAVTAGTQVLTDNFVNATALPDGWTVKRYNGSGNTYTLGANGAVNMEAWKRLQLYKEVSIDSAEGSTIEFDTYAANQDCNVVVFLSTSDYGVAVGNSYNSNPKIFIGDFNANATSSFVNFQKTELGTVPGNQVEVADTTQITTAGPLFYHLELEGTALTGWVKDADGKTRDISFTLPEAKTFTTVGLTMDGGALSAGIKRFAMTEKTTGVTPVDGVVTLSAPLAEPTEVETENGEPYTGAVTIVGTSDYTVTSADLAKLSAPQAASISLGAYTTLEYGVASSNPTDYIPLAGCTVTKVQTRSEYGAGELRLTGLPAGVNVVFTRFGGTVEDPVAVGEDGIAVLSGEVKIAGDATLFDVTFKNNTADTQPSGTFTYKGYEPATLVYDTTPTFYTVEGDEEATSVYIKHHPYISNAASALATLQNFSVVVVGQMSPSRKTQFINIGRTAENNTSLMIATTDTDNQVMIATCKGTAIDRGNAVFAAVPKAATTRHAYVITKVGDSMKVYVDGTLRGQIVLPAGFTMGSPAGASTSGIQVGSDFGGQFQNIKDSTNDNYCAPVAVSDDETGYLTVLRVYDYELSEAQRQLVADTYGAQEDLSDVYVRTLDTDGAFSATDAWTKGETAAAVPEKDGNARLVVVEDATLAVNASAALNKLTVEGPGTLTLAAGEGTISAVDAVVNTPVVIPYGSLNLAGTAIVLGDSGALAFDLSGFDLTTVYCTTYVPLTGLMEETDRVTVSAFPETNENQTAVELVRYNGAYAMKVTTTHEGGSDILWKSGYWGTSEAEDNDIVFMQGDAQINYFPGDVIVVGEGSPDTVYCGSGMVGTTLAIRKDVTVGTPTATAKTFDGMDVTLANPVVATLPGDAVITGNSHVTGGRLHVDGTLTVEAGSSVVSQIKGSGTVTVKVNSGMPAFNPAVDWKGTFVMPANNNSSSTPYPVNLNRYGTATSTIVLNDLTGRFSFCDGTDRTVAPTIDLEGSVNLAATNATTVTFTKLTGSGTLNIVSEDALVVITELEDFTGKITGETANVTLPEGLEIKADGTVGPIEDPTDDIKAAIGEDQTVRMPAAWLVEAGLEATAAAAEQAIPDGTGLTYAQAYALGYAATDDLTTAALVVTAFYQDAEGDWVIETNRDDALVDGLEIGVKRSKSLDFTTDDADGNFFKAVVVPAAD